MRKRLLIALPLVLILAILFWKALGHGTPTGQPPLASITAESLSAFQHDFDQAADQTRVLLLLSPT